MLSVMIPACVPELAQHLGRDQAALRRSIESCQLSPAERQCVLGRVLALSARVAAEAPRPPQETLQLALCVSWRLALQEVAEC